MDFLILLDFDHALMWWRRWTNSSRIDLSPTKTKLQQQNREILVTPPSSPTRDRLRSPTRERSKIPPTPYRESSDAFWSQARTNDWIDQHSPRKDRTWEPALDVQLLREFDETDSDDERPSMPISARKNDPVVPKTPSKTALKRAEAEKRKALLARKKEFDDKKAHFAEEFFRALDNAVTCGQIQRMAAKTGGVKIVWSKTLQTTAGRANWKRERTHHKEEGREPYSSSAASSSTSLPLSSTSSSSSSSSFSSAATSSSCLSRHYATIELAERIIDNEERLLNTLAHEYCHLANFMISNVHNNPHGASFKEWGRKCTQALRDHPVYGGRIEVTTKHSYTIDYRYVWCCVDCGQNYGRHSKSIDPSRSRCGQCRGLLQQVKPKPRNVSPKKREAAAAPGLGPAGSLGESQSDLRKKDVDDVIQVLEVVTLRYDEE